MCDTVAIVGDGVVYFAKNSDRDPNEAQFLDWRPRMTHPSGTNVKCTWIEIPQVAETNAVLLSRPFWMWGAEIGANEHGVVIGNEAVFTNQPYAKTGLTGMDLLRLALERASTAELAVNVVTGLLERFGQGGGCGYENRSFTYHNSFIVADPTKAIVLETAGKKWATEEVRGARTISNGLTIHGFVEKYSDTIKTTVSACRIRQPRTQELARQAKGTLDVFEILRDHGAGYEYPHYTWMNGGMGSPCMHAGGMIAGSQTTASWVAELREGDCRHWVTATSAPCISLFKPVYVTVPLDLGPKPTDVPDESLWWRHERYHRAVIKNPAALTPLIAHMRDETEKRWVEEPPESADAFAEGDSLLAQWTAAVKEEKVHDSRPGWLKRYWNSRTPASF